MANGREGRSIGQDIMSCKACSFCTCTESHKCTQSGVTELRCRHLCHNSNMETTLFHPMLNAYVEFQNEYEMCEAVSFFAPHFQTHTYTHLFTHASSQMSPVVRFYTLSSIYCLNQVQCNFLLLTV